jgi:hypothetical protein
MASPSSPSGDGLVWEGRENRSLESANWIVETSFLKRLITVPPLVVCENGAEHK